MNRITRVILGIAVVLVIVVLGFLLYFQITFPKVGPPTDIAVKSTPEMIERGEYLANNVAVCIDCHSKRNWQYYAGPIAPGTEGMGGDAFTEEMGIPGELYAKNITPAALGSWTDGEIIRAITTGVSRDGTALFPLMPYSAYKHMATEDVHAIVAYLRTLQPVENPDIPDRKLNFPLNLIVKTIPTEADPQPLPDPANTLAYGEYLTTIGGCAGCHTPMEKGAPIEEMYLAGGEAFTFPSGAVVRSMNITPDPQTGIGTWTKEAFITRFKMYDDSSMAKVSVPSGGMNTPMPWVMYSGMTEQDLGAIFTYLKTVRPIKNKVVRYTPPSE